MTKPSSEAEASQRANATHHRGASELFALLEHAPIPRDEKMHHVPLFLDRRLISRMLFANEVYELVVGVHGSICEFGVRYGQNLALMTSLRGIHEPYNHNRRLIGFDTFAGFPSVAAQDKPSQGPAWQPGDYGVTENYETFLGDVLARHEELAPVQQIRKFELVKGNASETVPAYLEAHPELVVALAYFDFDIYTPTRDVLTAIRSRLTRGSVLVFDELNVPECPGETVAVREILGLDKLRLRHSKYRAAAAYAVLE